MLTDLRAPLARIALNSLWLFLARVSSQGLMLVFTVLVARYLGQTGLGQYAFVAAVVFVGNVLTTFGLDTLLIREVASRRTVLATSMTAALGIQLALSALFIGTVGLGGRWLPNKTPETALMLWLYSLSLIPLAFTTVFSASLRAYERMDLILGLNLLSAAVQVGGTWLVLGSGGGLLALIVLVLAAQIVTAVVAGGMCVRRVPDFALDLRVSRRLIGEMLHQGAPLALVAGFAVVYQRIGVLMLSLLAGDALTGWFVAAARVSDALKMIHYAFFGAVFPLMSRLAVEGDLFEIGEDARELEQRLSRTSLRFLLGFGLLAALATTLLAGPVIDLLYGMNYTPAIAALQILVWSLIPFAINTYTFFWLVSRGREMSALKVNIMSSISVAMLYAILIPIFGLIGACLATLLGEMIQAALYLPYTRRRLAEGSQAVSLSRTDPFRGKSLVRE